jgi:hypothetical protein
MVVNHCETILTADGMQTWLNEDSVRHAGVCCSDHPKTAEIIAEEVKISVAIPSSEYDLLSHFTCCKQFPVTGHI